MQPVNMPMPSMKQKLLNGVKKSTTYRQFYTTINIPKRNKTIPKPIIDKDNCYNELLIKPIPKDEISR